MQALASLTRSTAVPRISSSRLLGRNFSIPPQQHNMSSTFCRVVNATEVAKPFSEEITQQIQTSLAAGGKKPKLVGFLCGSKDSPSAVYADWTRKACESVGIDYELRRIADEAEAEETGSETLGGAADLEAAILDANSDPAVNGIMVYYPTGAGQRLDSYIQQVVTREKDVEGMNFSYLFNLYHNIRQIDPRTISLSLAHSAKEASQQKAEGGPQQGPLVKSILPCTPLAVVKTLEYLSVYNNLLPYGQRAYGKVITVINRSEVVGRPLAALLANDGARVLSVDVDDIQEFNRRHRSKTSANTPHLPHHIVKWTQMSLEECLKISDVVITGVPSKGYKVKTEHLKDGVVAVNFSSEKNFEADIKEKASIYVPAIGKATISMLQRNLLRLAEYQKILDEQPVPSLSKLAAEEEAASA